MMIHLKGEKLQMSDKMGLSKTILKITIVTCITALWWDLDKQYKILEIGFHSNTQNHGSKYIQLKPGFYSRSICSSHSYWHHLASHASNYGKILATHRPYE